LAGKETRAPESEDRLLAKAIVVLKGMAPYGRRHARVFAMGALAAGFVVAARLALPWPLRAIADIWVGAGADAATATVAQGTIHPAILMGFVFFAILVVLGLADMFERLYFARFSIGLVRDLRADTFGAVMKAQAQRKIGKRGDLVARLVGDTARVKAGMKTFLVHVLTNGVVFLGVTVVLLSLDVALGLVFSVAAVGTAAVTWWGAGRMFRRSLSYRTKEGKLANTIERALRHGPTDDRFRKINRSSGSHEAALTRTQGITTWTTYTVFGLTVLAALWVGVNAVEAGRIAAGDMVVFMMYALMMRGPIVRLARQGSQTGKVFGAGYRIIQAREAAVKQARSHGRAAIAPLQETLRLSGVVVKGSKSRSSRPRLGPIDVAISAGEHVLVTGEAAAGKTTLLELLAGHRRPTEGRVLWDGTDLAEFSPEALAAHVRVVPRNPRWPRKPIRELLSIDGELHGLESFGLDEIMARCPKGGETRLGSTDLSPGERKLVALGQTLEGNATLRLVDEPTVGLGDEQAQAALVALLNASRGATLVVAMSRPVETGHFDRVIELHQGQVAYDGSPEVWSPQMSGTGEGLAGSQP
jgi:ABC-type multidrug transport system fused ATPase/permease subunit